MLCTQYSCTAQFSNGNGNKRCFVIWRGSKLRPDNLYAVAIWAGIIWWIAANVNAYLLWLSASIHLCYCILILIIIGYLKACNCLYRANAVVHSRLGNFVQIRITHRWQTLIFIFILSIESIRHSIPSRKITCAHQKSTNKTSDWIQHTNRYLIKTMYYIYISVANLHNSITIIYAVFNLDHITHTLSQSIRYKPNQLMKGLRSYYAAVHGAECA